MTLTRRELIGFISFFEINVFLRYIPTKIGDFWLYTQLRNKTYFIKNEFMTGYPIEG